MTTFTKLPITPAPKSYESPLGYALKVSQLNGFFSFGTLHSFITASSHVLRAYDLEPYASWVGHEIELQAISYGSRKLRGPSRTFNFNGHTISRRHFDLTFPRVCPLCIQETGTTDRLWDLAFSTVCTKHNIFLTSDCKTCGSRLSWFRKYVDRCKCGEFFCIESTAPSEACLQIHRQINHMVLLDNPTPFDRNEILKDLSPEIALSLISFLGTLAMDLGLRMDWPWSNHRQKMINSVATLMTNWTNELPLFLNQAISHHSIPKIAQSLSSWMMKHCGSQPPVAVKQIQDYLAINSDKTGDIAIDQDWISIRNCKKISGLSERSIRRLCDKQSIAYRVNVGRVLLDKKSRSEPDAEAGHSEKMELVTFKEAALAYGLSERNLRRRYKNGATKLSVIQTTSKILVNREQFSKAISSIQKYQDMSAVAKKLFIPTKIVKRLLENIDFWDEEKVTLSVKKIDDFCQSINKRILPKTVDEGHPSWFSLSISQSAAINAELISRITKGEIRIYASAGKRWPNVNLHIGDCIKIFSSTKKKQCMLPIKVVGQLFSIKHHDLRELCKADFIKSKVVKRYLLIDIQSIQEFFERYTMIDVDAAKRHLLPSLIAELHKLDISFIKSLTRFYLPTTELPYLNRDLLQSLTPDN